MKARVSSSKVRMLPPMVTVSGITLAAVPAFMVPMVSTARSSMASSRAWISWRAMTMWAAAVRGSMPVLGMEPWQPLPWTVMSK